MTAGGQGRERPLRVGIRSLSYSTVLAANFT
jgi:hypothetical protein